MKNSFTKLFILFLLTGFLSFSYSQVTHSIDLSWEALTTKTIVGEDDNNYTKISLGTQTMNLEVSAPELPVKYVKLIIPNDEKPISFTVTKNSSQLLALESLVFPVQEEDNPWDDKPAAPFVKPNKVIYNSSEPYPAEMVRLVNDGFFDGANHIITLEIMPFQYYPSTNQLYYYSSISFTVNTSKHSYNTIIPGKRFTRNQVKIDNQLADLVDNPENISSYQTRTILIEDAKNKPNKDETTVSIPFYEYVIITTAILEPYFNNFVDWKRKKDLILA